MNSARHETTLAKLSRLLMGSVPPARDGLSGSEPASPPGVAPLLEPDELCRAAPQLLRQVLVLGGRAGRARPLVHHVGAVQPRRFLAQREPDERARAAI